MNRLFTHLVPRVLACTNIYFECSTVQPPCSFNGWFKSFSVKFPGLVNESSQMKGESLLIVPASLPCVAFVGAGDKEKKQESL